MVPLIKGKNAGWRTEFLYEYMAEKPFPGIPSVLAVRTNRWKYIRYPEIDDIEELYDLKNDQYELKNLASDPKHAATLNEMKKKMDLLLIETRGKEFWDKHIAEAKAAK
jgi:N-acetylglucosamine-6-sulfatase